MDWSKTSSSELEKHRKEDRKTIRGLQRDLQRKEKALAETAALLVLSKKFNALLGEEES